VSQPVLDASAVLALLNKEPGHEQVLAVLPTASIGTVNLTEVISKLCECCVPSDAAMEAVQCLGVEVVLPSLEHALRAGELRPITKAFGLSLGDRACLALGRERNATVITAERHWDERVEAVAAVRIQRIWDTTLPSTLAVLGRRTNPLRGRRCGTSRLPRTDALGLSG
jgi:PIN domain nuclease of toxin-antitoxin system